MKNILLSVLTLISICSPAQDWTWLRGNSTASVVANYGTIGISAPTNDPGSRHGAACWTDASGNLWQFGGEGYASTPTMGWLNDLWKYNPATNEWTWIRGSTTINQNGKYGTMGVSSPTNEPGGREFPTYWKDNSGNFWLFGGDGWDAFGTWGRLNDLWRYDPGTNQWTWISGSNSANQNGVYGSPTVFNPANIPGARHGGVAWTDASNNFWLYAGYGYPASGPDGHLNDLWKYNPVTNQWACMKGNNTINKYGVYSPKGVASPTNVPGGREFPAMWKDATGKVWIFGGGGWPISTSSVGHLNDLWSYDMGTNNWTYQSGTNLGNQIGVNGTKGVPSSTNNPGGRYSAVSVTDNWGNLYLFGGIGFPGSPGLGELNEVWRYTPSTDEWTWLKGNNAVNVNGIYGTMGVSSTSNTPGSRYYNIGWKDLNGDMWIFGSFGYASTGPLNQLNDLWKFRITCAPYDITDAFAGNVCAGNAAVLSVATVSSSVITWYSSPVSTVALGTGTTFTTGPLSVGNYTFYAEGSPCNMRTPVTVSVSACTNISTTSGITTNVKLFPNPNNGAFFIASDTEGELVLYNTLGQEVYRKEITVGKNYLENHFSKGVYFYFIEEKGTKLKSGKMIVE